MRDMPRTALLSLALALVADLASAQIIQGPNVLRTGETPPTARSQALGGTGIALADDAGAALLNPAGLAFLVRGEVSADLGAIGRTESFVSGGRIATPDALVTEAQRVTDPTATGIVAYPLRRLGYAAYFRFFENVQDVEVPALSLIGNELRPDTVAISASRRYRMQFGGALGFAIIPSVAVGVAAHAEADQLSAGYFAGNDSMTSYTSKALGVGYQLGVTWVPGRTFSAGAVYRAPMSREVSVIETFGRPASSPEVTVVPTSIGMGVALRPIETVRLFADVVSTRHSEVQDLFALLLVLPLGDVEAEDTVEVRGGAEYLIARNAGTIALRAGLRTDPAHSPVYAGSDSVRRLVLAERAGDRLHKTFGVGFALNRFEIGGSVDTAPGWLSVLTSCVIRFD